MRGFAYVLTLQAEVDAGRGDWNGAVNADLDAIQLGETMPRGGPLIGMLVGDACQAVGRRHAWDAVDHLSAAQARAAAHRLETIRLSHVPLADTLQEEEWCAQAGLLELMHERDWPGNLATVLSADQHGDRPMSDWQGATRIRMTGKRTVMADYTRYMDQSIANARRPYAAHPEMPSFPTDPVNQILLPVFAGGHLTEVNAETQNALLLTALALRAYKLDHGADPPTLAALVPGYLQAVPDDPFALSGPLCYKRVGAKPLVYSVGPDGKDDSGKAIFDRTIPAPTNADGYDRRHAVQENSVGDIVAGVNTG
jgi:type II secretory pathway pseudopilin PulG